MNPNKSSTKVSLPSTKAGNKVQIGVPSLCSYDDDSGEEEEKQIEKEIESNPNLKKSLEAAYAPKREAGQNDAKKAESFGKKPSGLLSILPPPRAHSTISFLKKPSASSSSSAQGPATSTTPATTTSLLLPRTLKPPTQAKTLPPVSSAQIVQEKKELKKAPVEKSSSLAFLQYGYDDSDDEESEKKILKELEEKAAKELEEAEKVPAKANPVARSRKPIEEAKCKFELSAGYGEDPELELNEDDDEVKESRPLNINTNGAPATQPELNEEAWQKLVGGKKRKMEAFEIMDVNAKDIVGDATANLTKQITDEYRPASNRDYFSSGSKRKHQITYLAYVAKERDQELRQAWADAKHNRSQAKMKYGF